MCFEHLGQVLDRAEDRTAEHVAGGLLVVEEADHLEAELAMIEDLLRHLAAEPAGADDQDAREVVAATPQRAHGLADREAAGGDVEVAQHRERGEEAAAVGEGEVGIERLGRPVERREAGDQNGSRTLWRTGSRAPLRCGCARAAARTGRGSRRPPARHRQERQQPQVIVEVRGRLLADQGQQEIGLETQPPRREERGDDGDDVTDQTRGRVRAAALMDQAPTLSASSSSAKTDRIRSRNLPLENREARLRRFKILKCIPRALSMQPFRPSIPSVSG